MHRPPHLLIPGEYTENIILESPAVTEESSSEGDQLAPSPSNYRDLLPSERLSRRSSQQIAHARSDSDLSPKFFNDREPVESHPNAKVSTHSLPGYHDRTKYRVDEDLLSPATSAHSKPDSPRKTRSRSPPSKPAFLTKSRTPRPVSAGYRSPQDGGAAVASSVHHSQPEVTQIREALSPSLDPAFLQVEGHRRRSKSPGKAPASSRPSSYAGSRRRKVSSRTSSRHIEHSDSDSDDSDALRQGYVPYDTFTAWTLCDRRLRRHDRNMVKAWKEDIDNILVFAGLFSAVLTAFIVEAYKLLQADPKEVLVVLVQQILVQLGNVTFIQGLSSDFAVPTYAIRINTLWFASLVFSLSAASIGILVKQWLQNYLSATASSPRENARIRQFRHQGLLDWHIPEVIAFLPILLQVALALFFVGMVDLLWKLNAVVAGVVTVFVTASLTFVVVTTITPAFSRHCPHKSPQSLAAYRVKQWIARGFMYALLRFSSSFSEPLPFPTYIPEQLFRRSWVRRLRTKCLSYVHGRHHHTWRDREKTLMRRDAEREHELDRQVLASADITFMDDAFLRDVLRMCLNDTAWPSAVGCLQDIITNRAHHWVNGVPQWKICSRDKIDTALYTLIHLVADALPRIDSREHTMIGDMVMYLENLCVAFPFQVYDDGIQLLYRHVLSSLSRCMLYGEVTVRKKVYNLILAIVSKAWYEPLGTDVTVLQDIVNFSKHCFFVGDMEAFHGSCAIALRLIVDSEVPAASEALLSNVRQMLLNLETSLLKYVEQLTPDAVPASGPEQSVSLGTSADIPVILRTRNTGPPPSHTHASILLRAVCVIAENKPHGLDVRAELIKALYNVITSDRLPFDFSSQEGRNVWTELVDLYHARVPYEPPKIGTGTGRKSKRRGALNPEQMERLARSTLHIPSPVLLSASPTYSTKSMSLRRLSSSPSPDSDVSPRMHRQRKATNNP